MERGENFQETQPELEVEQMSERSSTWLNKLHEGLKDHPYLDRAVVSGAFWGAATASWKGAAVGAVMGLAGERLMQWARAKEEEQLKQKHGRTL